MKTSSRAALIRKIEKEMDRVEVECMRPTEDVNYHYVLDGQFLAYSHVLWLLKDTEDL